MSISINIGTNSSNPYVNEPIPVADEPGNSTPIGTNGGTQPTNSPAVVVSLSANAETALSELASGQLTAEGQVLETIVISADRLPKPPSQEVVTVYGQRIVQTPTSRDGNYTIDGFNEQDGYTWSRTQPDDIKMPFVHDEFVGNHKIGMKVDRALTEKEEAALKALKDAIAKIDEAMKKLPDGKILTLPNGKTVSTTELKELWSKAQFRINEAGTSYQNGSTRGEAAFDPKTGELTATMNIDIISGYYSAGKGGIEYMLFHELGHVTKAGLDSNADAYKDDGKMDANEHHANELLANDIARAIQDALGLDTFPNPTRGYTTPAPLPFQDPVDSIS